MFSASGARPKETTKDRAQPVVIPQTTTRSGITEAKRAFFSTPGYQTIGDPLLLQSGAAPGGTGKVCRGCESEPPYDDIRSSQIMDMSFNPNYETVDQKDETTGSGVMLVDNPDYESVDANFDKPNTRKPRGVDPNYESVDLVFDDSQVKVTIVENRTEPDYEIVPREEETEEVTAPPMMAAGGSTAAVGNGTSKQWQRREPIYSEIDEETTENEGKKKKK